MRVQRGGNAQHQLRHKEYQHRRDRTNRLKQHTGYHQTERLASDCKKAEDTVDPALQLVRDQCDSIAVLHHYAAELLICMKLNGLMMLPILGYDLLPYK